MDLRISLVILLFVIKCNGYNVLVLAPLNAKSHFMYMQSFVSALHERGHNVTYLTSNSLSHLKLANYTEVLIDPPLDITTMRVDTSIDKGESSAFTTIRLIYTLTRIWNEYNLKNSNVQKFIHTDGLHFDVIINEEFFNDSFMMFGYKFQAPIVSICSFGTTEFLERNMGMLSPLAAFVPHWTLPFSDRMSFSERWYNSVVSAYDWILRQFVYFPSEDAFAKKYFGHLGSVPSINELQRNISLYLVNSHSALAPSRPTMPSIINIGGAHLKPIKLLPTDLQKFLDESKHGAIYFSLGTVVKTSALPMEKIRAFLDTFKSLKQRVLWKFEDESLVGVPPNVMVRKWMPQNDILSHPNVILFISHGGLFGTIESLYHGIPLLLIPFFGDQFRNAHRIQVSGYGKFVGFRDITKETFSKAINEIVSNESFLSKAKETSAIFKDNLVHPMDEAIFWIEHVAKFKGAKHLKSHAVNMSWFTYLLLDVLFVNMLGVLGIICVLYWLIKRIFSKNKPQRLLGKKEN